ncbi:MAG: DNA-formamidopyrimidine glycosylase [Acidobacteriaceae bacterium]|nr:DNA-formamidopyrimidine glycosylase [Acidobacteriaceae bacterium]MBV9780701.1 DNA-formamidopyrimidine glycosylase [Acidobacteriaceae bacterium]
MPELPEVETVVRSLRPHLVGQTVRCAQFYSRLVTRGSRAHAARSLAGAVILGIRRRGKQIFFDLDRGLLYIHLGMTGKLLWNTTPGKHARAKLELDNGTLIYDDPRQFGRVEFFKQLPPALNRLGPDALDIPFENFYARLKQHRGQVKPLLLNQCFLSGLGNIYIDEILFAARIHPRAPVARFSKKRAQILHKHLGEILQLAIRHRGSSISDYVDGAGDRGAFQQLHQVYGRAGERCPNCATKIHRIVIGQRGTHYCPRCQRS